MPKPENIGTIWVEQRSQEQQWLDVLGWRCCQIASQVPVDPCLASGPPLHNAPSATRQARRPLKQCSLNAAACLLSVSRVSSFSLSRVCPSKDIVGASRNIHRILWLYGDTEAKQITRTVSCLGKYPRPRLTGSIMRLMSLGIPKPGTGVARSSPSKCLIVAAAI